MSVAELVQGYLKDLFGDKVSAYMQPNGSIMCQCGRRGYVIHSEHAEETSALLKEVSEAVDRFDA